MSDDAWKPEGWGSWSPTRRTLWRREKQIENMERLLADDPTQAVKVEGILTYMRAEVSELRARLLEGHDT